MDILVQAFFTETLVRWLYPDDQHYLTAMPSIFNCYVDDAINNSAGYTSEELDGLLIYSEPDMPISSAKRIELHGKYLSKEKMQSIYNYAEEIGKMCTGKDWCYLNIGAVHPEAQGKGVGSRLLIKKIQELKDLKYLSISLDTTGEAKRKGYEKFGFKVMKERYITDKDKTYLNK